MLNEQEVKAAYCELAPKLTNYLVANGLEYTVACDIVQETFIRLWKKSGELSATDSISGFVFAVARNLRTDYYRRSKFMIYQDEIADEDAGILPQKIHPPTLSICGNVFRMQSRSFRRTCEPPILCFRLPDVPSGRSRS